MFRLALIFMLGLLTAGLLLVAVAFNNVIAWLLILSLIAGLILVFSAAAGRLDMLRASCRESESLSLQDGRRKTATKV